MADDDHGDRLARQVALEPLGGGDVQVVRWLVEQHHVGALEQQLGEQHARLLAAGECRRLALEFGLAEAEARQDLLDPMIDRVRVLVLDLVVDGVVAKRRPLAVVLVLGLGHLVGGLFQLVLELEQRRQTGPDDLDHRLAGLEVGLLPQQADADAGPDVQIAVIRPIVAGQELHQGRLARAVGADEPDPLAGAHLERKVLEDRIAAELPAEPCCRDQDHGIRTVLRWVPVVGVRGGRVGRGETAHLPGYRLGPTGTRARNAWVAYGRGSEVHRPRTRADPIACSARVSDRSVPVLRQEGPPSPDRIGPGPIGPPDRPQEPAPTTDRPGSGRHRPARSPAGAGSHDGPDRTGSVPV